MKSAKIDERQREQAHRYLDSMFDLGLCVFIGGKEQYGGLMCTWFGHKHTIVSLLRNAIKTLDPTSNG